MNNWEQLAICGKLIEEQISGQDKDLQEIKIGLSKSDKDLAELKLKTEEAATLMCMMESG